MKLEHWYSGIVIHGNQNGRKFGFPTANIELYDKNIVAKTGIYAVNVQIDEQFYRGMLYIGTRPTLHLHNISFEINIFDFNQQIYGKEIHFQPLKKFFEEKKFDSIDEMITHIKHYKEIILNYFNE